MKQLLVMGVVAGLLGQASYAADPAAAFGLRGNINVDYRTEVISFGFVIGSRANHYRVEGMTRPDKGIYSSNQDLEAVEVVRKDGKNELVLASRGSVLFYPRKRFLSDVEIAGIKMEGRFLQGAFNDGIFLDGLDVDGDHSHGLIDYNNFVGYYRAKRGAQFGNMKISSTEPGSNILSNLDNYIAQNKMSISMQLGDLKLQGSAYYNDQDQTSTDSDGDTHTYTVATTCKYDVAITRADGKTIELAAPGEAPTSDDIQIRKLIAMLVLFSYDMH